MSDGVGDDAIAEEFAAAREVTAPGPSAAGPDAAAPEDVGASLVRRFRSRSAIYFAADVLVKLFAVGLFLETVQTFGPERFGRLSRVAALLGVAAAVGDFGLGMLLLRRVGGLGEGASLAAAERRRFVLLRMAMTALAVLGCVGYLSGSGAPDEVVVAAGGGGAGLLVRVFSDLVGSELRGRGRARADFCIRIFSGLAFVASGLAVVHLGFGVAGFGAAWFASAVIAALVAGVVSFGRPAAAAPPAAGLGTRTILRDAMPFGILSICMIVYFRIDTEMVARMRGDGDAGIYGTAYRMFEVCLLLPAAASAALVPLFAGAFERGRLDEVRRLVGDGFRNMALVGGVAAVLLFGLGPMAVRLLLRDDVGAAAGVFQVLVWTVPVIFLSSVTSSLIAASRFAHVNTRIAMLMVVENVLLNLVAIPRWGPAGAAAATVLTEATGLVVNLVVVRRRIGGFPMFTTLARIAGATAAGVAVTVAAGGWAGAFAGAAVFAAAWYAVSLVQRAQSSSRGAA